MKLTKQDLVEIIKEELSSIARWNALVRPLAQVKAPQASHATAIARAAEQYSDNQPIDFKVPVRGLLDSIMQMIEDEGDIRLRPRT